MVHFVVLNPFVFAICLKATPTPRPPSPPNHLAKNECTSSAEGFYSEGRETVLAASALQSRINISFFLQ